MAAPSSTTMTSAELTISALLAEAAEHLHTAGIDNPRAEARWLIGHALGLPASDLILEADRVPSPELVSLRPDQAIMVVRATFRTVAKMAKMFPDWRFQALLGN